MFTGIVQAIGQIESVQPQSLRLDQHSGPQGISYSDQQGLRLQVSWGGLDFTDVSQGDSIALNGACMTVLDPTSNGFSVDISRESLNRTVSLDRVGPVNLEKAMRLGDRFGGHMVSGHIDATADVLSIEPIDESVRLAVRIPVALSPFVTEKGSVALHGVSLTVNKVTDTSKGSAIEINLIPHTWGHTVLQWLQPGDRLNIEVDPLARQVARLLESWKDSGRLSIKAGP